MFPHSRFTLPGILLLLATVEASGLCLPIVHHVNVGSSTASGCDYVYADLQTAINNVSCPNTVLSIAGGVTLANVALEINGKTNLTIVGLGAGTTCTDPPPACDPTIGCGGGGGAPPAPNVTLQGTGAGSVFYIHGSSSVTLESLVLKNGGGTDFGGGIHFTGGGSLTIVNSTITNNSANSQGGGIQFNASSDATLTLDAGTIIEHNSSGGDGGGIHVNGYARMFALEPYTWIFSNQALNGLGGGLYVEGPARADIGSPGNSGAPVVDFNDAKYGGGIAVRGGTSSSFAGTVRLFTVDPDNPVQVSNNSASSRGGAIYAHGTNSNGNFNPAVACAFDSRIDANIAPDGAAVYLDYENDGFDLGSVLRLNGSESCGPESPPTLGAVPCTPGIACNEISGNSAEDGLGNPTTGSVILVGSASAQSIDRLVMRGNSAASLLKLVGNGGDLSGPELQNCLFADNHTQQELISVRRSDGQYFDVSSCTFANDTIDAGSALHADANTTLVLTNNIFALPGVPTLEYSGGAVPDITYILSNDTATLPVAPGVIQGSPTFVDPAHGDYHLRATSLGVDFAPAIGGYDLDRVPRDVDLAPVPNYDGPRDIGAYERQYVCAADTLFCDGFEAYQ